MSFCVYNESDGKSVFTDADVPAQLLFLMQAAFSIYCCGELKLCFLRTASTD